MRVYLLYSFLTVFFFNDTATTEIYTLSLHDALPISSGSGQNASREPGVLGVETSVATVAPFPHVVSAIGTVTPRPDRFAALAPPGQTRVARIFVVAGQRVAEGDALVEFERASFDAAAQSAAAALANAERA